MKRYLNLLTGFLYGLCGVLWIINALRNDRVFYLVLGLLWLCGGVIWLVRFRKENNDSDKEN